MDLLRGHLRDDRPVRHVGVGRREIQAQRDARAENGEEVGDLVGSEGGAGDVRLMEVVDPHGMAAMGHHEEGEGL